MPANASPVTHVSFRDERVGEVRPSDSRAGRGLIEHVVPREVVVAPDALSHLSGSREP
jgi:hypothetical protein